MVVLEQFYQIAERKTSHVSPLWKVAHTFICIVSAICGFLTAFTFGRILKEFGYNCILNSEIVFSNETFLNNSRDESAKHPRAIDLMASNWGPFSACNFAQFTPLVIMISAVIWGTYFLVISRGGAGYSTDLLGRPWAIVYPCIFFTTIFCIVYIISTTRLKRGVNEFCVQFKPEFNNTDCVKEIGMYTQQFDEKEPNIFTDFYLNIMIAITTAEIGMWSWIIQIILCVLRVLCVSDFDLQLVTISNKEDEKILEDLDLTSDSVEEVADV